MKICSTCQINKSLSEFGRNKSKPDGLQTMCKPCKAAYNSLYHSANRDKYRPNRRDAKLRARKRAQAFVAEYLSSRSCADCGLDELAVLEFDHLDGKEFSINKACSQGYTVPRIEAEVAKCEVVCANCHRRRTYARLPQTWRTTNAGSEA